MSTRNYLRPPWAARVIGGRMARLVKPKVVSLLSVPGRTTGAWRSTPVAVLDLPDPADHPAFRITVTGSGRA
ncbi:MULTISPECIES: hypothetical protein [unclassified Streptomyces]|uniref:hypothetical protein n=1 Tax=unclassified Streptomyces TaxID=2593676 RepID=UPI002E16E1ED